MKLLLLLLATQAHAILPTQVTSGTLKLWLKADAGVTLSGNAVAIWADQSGNGADCAMLTAANRPAYVASDAGRRGLASISFTAGTSNWLTSTASIVTGTNARTVMFNSYYINSSSQHIADFAYTAVCGGGHWALGNVDVFGCGTDVTGLAGFGGSAATYQVMTWTWTGGNPGTLVRYTDNTQISTGNGAAWSTGSGYVIGAWYVGPNDPYTGRIGEVLVFQGVLSDADRAAMVSYLQNGNTTAPNTTRSLFLDFNASLQINQ